LRSRGLHEAGDTSATGLGLGARYYVTEHLHLLGSMGPGVRNASDTNRYSWYAALADLDPLSAFYRPPWVSGIGLSVQFSVISDALGGSSVAVESLRLAD
jgi:hypothetical protein